MPEPEVDPELASRWSTRIRWAFGVPDLLTDEHARRLIGSELATKFDHDSIKYRGVPAVVEAVVAQGAVGLLDHCLIEDDDPQVFDGAIEKETLCREIGRKVAELPNASI